MNKSLISESYRHQYVRFKYRSRAKIVYEILKATSEGIGMVKTRIGQVVNLGYYEREKFLRKMIDQGLLCLTERNTLVTMKKGKELVRLLENAFTYFPI